MSPSDTENYRRDAKVICHVERFRGIPTPLTITTFSYQISQFKAGRPCVKAFAEMEVSR